MNQTEKVVKAENEVFTEKKQIDPIPDQQYINDYIYDLNTEGYKAKALYDYQAGM